jgi:hypothetical protein
MCCTEDDWNDVNINDDNEMMNQDRSAASSVQFDSASSR